MNEPLQQLCQIVRPCPEAGDLARAVAGVGDWDSFLGLAGRHGFLPLLYWRLGRSDVAGVPGGVRERLASHFHLNLAGNLRRSAELARVVSWFRAEGVEVAAYKGPTLAVQAYRNLGLRQFGDLDLLVRPERVNDAVRILCERGYAPKDALGAHSLAGNNEIALRGPQAEIDLHWQVSPKYFFRFTDSAVWGRLEPVMVADRPIPAMCPDDLFVALALHGARHCWASLGLICDVAWLLEAQGQRLDWDSIFEGAARAGTLRSILLAVLLASDLTDGIPAGVLGRAGGDRVAKELAEQARSNLDAVHDVAGTLEGARMHIRMADRSRDKIAYAVKRALLPNQTDNNAISLPRCLKPFLYLARPFRIAAKSLGGGPAN